MGRQRGRGGPVRQGRRRDAGPRQDGHPRPQDALRHRRGGAAHRGAHRRAGARLGAAARRPRGLQAHPLGAHRRPLPARELGAAQFGDTPTTARLRRRHRRHLAVPPGAAAGRHDRAVHPAAARARACHRAAPCHGTYPATHLRGDRLPGAGHRGGGRRSRFQPRRGRPAQARDDARALPGGDGRDRPHLRREGGGPGRLARGGRRSLPPASRLRRLRLQQSARRLLRDRLQRLGVAQGALPGRVLLRPPQQPAHGLLLAARGAQRRAALRACRAASGHQPERRVVRGRGRRQGVAGGAGLRQRDERRGTTGDRRGARR